MMMLEPSIIMIMLLTGLLNARPRLSGLAKLGIAVALMLAFVAPSVSLLAPHSWFSAIVIPLLLWQSAQRLANARWPIRRQDIVIWLLIAGSIGAMLVVTSNMKWSAALLFGVLASSILWRTAEEDEAHPTHLGQVGMLALAFLLAEIAPFFESTYQYALGLIGGAALGALVGYIFVNIAREWTRGAWFKVCSFGQAYVAYGIAIMFGLSGVACAALSIVVYVAYGTQRGLWPAGIIKPQPLNSRPVFIAGVAVLAYFSWQMHKPVSSVLLLEGALSMIIAALGIALGRRFGSMGFTGKRAYADTLVSVVMQVLPAILLWPRDIQLSPVPLGAALIMAWLLTLGSRWALTPLLNVYRFLATEDTEIKKPDFLASGTLIKEVMTVDIPRARPEAPASEIAALLVEGSLGCVPIIDPDGRLAGLVTERDLFIKQEPLPLVTHASLFKERIQPEQLPEVYAEIIAKHTAADIMNRRVVSLNEGNSIRNAILIMAENGYDCIPVLSSAPGEKEKVVGILTRKDIIRAFSRETPL
jgi:CBS domain-containing protein